MSESIRDIVLLAAERLAAAGVESPRHDAETLLAHFLHVPPGQVALLDRLAHVDAVPAPELESFWAAVSRRESREPLQHITGTAGFRYLDVQVGAGVFVPRPETEVMTGVAVAELHRLIGTGTARPLAVDLCTGSAAVAAALATEAPGTSVTAVEVAPAAYEYALRNTAGLSVDVRLGDMAHAVSDLAGSVDVVTANPPYIPLSAFESVAAEARGFDPPEALWSGDDGLDAIRTVAVVAAMLLVDGGLLVCEHADVQGTAATQLFSAAGNWAQVRDNLDLAGRPRFVSARRIPRDSGAAGTMAG